MMSYLTSFFLPHFETGGSITTFKNILMVLFPLCEILLAKNVFKQRGF